MKSLIKKVLRENNLEHPINVGDVLYCHKTLHDDYTAGKSYEVTNINYNGSDEGYDVISVKDNKNSNWQFTIQKDQNDLNYENWFSLYDESFDTNAAFASLYESENEIKFSVGDRVVVNERNAINNEIGTIVYIDNEEPNILHYVVEFDTWNEGHSAGGIDVCKKHGHCWWVEVQNMELAPDTYSMMDKLYESENKPDYSELRHSEDLTGLKLRDKNGTLYTVTNQVEAQLSMTVDFTLSNFNIKERKMTMWLKDLVRYLEDDKLEIVELPGGSDISLDNLYENDDLEWAQNIVNDVGDDIKVSWDDKMCRIGQRVVRGRDWSYGNQNMDSAGTIVANPYSNMGDYWVRVRWDSKRENSYKVGPKTYDLYYDIESKNVNENEDPLEWAREVLNDKTNIGVDYHDIKVGDRVVRGKDWIWNIQNRNKDGEETIGTVIEIPYLSVMTDEYWVRVKWDTGRTGVYRVGSTAYDLYHYKEPKNINESEDPLDWVKDLDTDPYIKLGQKFFIPQNRIHLEIIGIDFPHKVITPTNSNTYLQILITRPLNQRRHNTRKREVVNYALDSVKNAINQNYWRPIDKIVKEENDLFDWVEDLKGQPIEMNLIEFEIGDEIEWVWDADESQNKYISSKENDNNGFGVITSIVKSRDGLNIYTAESKHIGPYEGILWKQDSQWEFLHKFYLINRPLIDMDSRFNNLTMKEQEDEFENDILNPEYWENKLVIFKPGTTDNDISSVLKIFQDVMNVINIDQYRADDYESIIESVNDGTNPYIRYENERCYYGYHPLSSAIDEPILIEYKDFIKLFNPLDTEEIFNNLNEQEDEFEWARDVLKEPIKYPYVGGIYRVTASSRDIDKAWTMDIMITKIEDGMVYDITKAEVDEEKTNMDHNEIENFLEKYNINDVTKFKEVESLIKNEFWTPIRKEDSLFNDTINEHEDDFEWTKDIFTALPNEFVITFCDEPITMDLLNQIQDVLPNYKIRAHGDSELYDDEWVRDIGRGGARRVVMYYDVIGTDVEWYGYDTCTNNMVKDYKHVFTIREFLTLYGNQTINESSNDNINLDDDFQWAKDMLKDIDYRRVKWIRTSDGKRFKNMVNKDMEHPWSSFFGWDNWFIVDGVEFIDGQLCFLTQLLISDSNKSHIQYYTPIEDYDDNEMSFDDRRPKRGDEKRK